MRVLIAAGGTGGHLFPALAIARSLKKRDQATEIQFVGPGGGKEAEWLRAEGFPLHQIAIRGLKGKKMAQFLDSLSLLPRALGHSWCILSRVEPDVTAGVGGYVSGPLLLLSALRGIPNLILEQNAFPGLTNRILARFVKEIAYSFPGSERHFAGGKAKLTLTGNPIRREILQGRRERAAVEFDLDPHRFTLLTFGGSQGASKINHSLLEALPHLLPLREKLQFLHATGEKDFEAVASGFAQHPFSAKVHPFIRDMASAYALADLVISRAGASTIAELAALGKPSILIPYPYAANDHQRHNAQALANTGGAQVLLDQELKGTTLARLIERAFQDPEGREAMGRRARAWAKVDADDQIADLIWGLASHPG